MDLFAYTKKNECIQPLAEKMRPNNLQDFIGQEHIVGEGKFLRRAIEADKLGSCIFYGPSGLGKTTLAHIIAITTKGEYIALNAVESGIAEIKKAIEIGKENLYLYNKRTYLLLDECHRFNKTQLDSLLPAIEKGYIVFIGSTTENPYANLTPALISRCHIFPFYPLQEQQIICALQRASYAENGLKRYNVQFADGVLAYIAHYANGDMRMAYNILELAVLSSKPKQDTSYITLKDIEECVQQKALSIDNTSYYNLLSAFCKSLRGSDSNASLYYAFRLIESGVDPLILLRRLIVHASEDVGLADSNALQVATSALQAFKELGAPEGYIPLTHAIIYVAEAEKSNSVVLAMARATKLAKSTVVNCPPYLNERSYASKESLEVCKQYLYPHDFGGYVKQQYLPDAIVNEEIYTPLQNGEERKIFQKQLERRK